VTGGLVPSPDLPTGAAALDHLLPGKRSVSAAVAFVSRPGAKILATLLEQHGVTELELVARGAPTTDPRALVELREKLHADVRVVAGAGAVRFHPKLWLLRSADGLDVLSGSGNLTAGGLGDNREQFEILRLTDGAEQAEQERRFASLTAGSVPLEAMMGSIAWREWLNVAAERERLNREIVRLDERLARSPTLDVGRAEEALEKDLWRIHDLTVAAKLPDPNSETGRPYNPSGFRLELEGHRGATGPAHVVRRLCRQGTRGFEVILASGHWEFTVEALIVDPTTPYYELFRGELRERSEERLRQFPNWPGTRSR
jgi:hypothetical protein